MKPAKSPWRLTLEKRARKQEKLVQLASIRLVDPAAAQLAAALTAHTRLGIHLGLLVLANSAPKTVDLKSRARWILNWLIGYMLEQDYTVDDIATDNGLAALEAVVVLACTAKQPRDKQPKIINNVMYAQDGTPLDEPWQEVHRSAWQFINALETRA